MDTINKETARHAPRTRRRPSPLTVARPLAPEDIRPGSYIAVSQIVWEFCAFWLAELWCGPPVYSVSLIAGNDIGTPLRVKEVCLPFVLAQAPDGTHRTIDVRRVRLLLLSDRFGKKASKKLKGKLPKPPPGCGIL
jgi:hypothetical protein